MATYYSNDFRAGLKIMLDGEPYAVEASEFVNQVKARRLRALSCAVCSPVPALRKPSNLPIPQKARTLSI